MDFQLSEDQEALRDSLRSFCEAEAPAERLPEFDKSGGFDAALWGELAEMGVFGLRLSEADGGVGLGSADAVLAFSELGRRLVPGPLVWTHLAASLVDGAATGACVVGGLDCMGALANDPVLIEHWTQLDQLIVLRPDGVHRVDPKSLDAQAIDVPLDPLTPLHRVAQLPDGDKIGGADDAQRLRLEGAALVSGQLLGIAEATLELTNAYVKERQQFDRPIGGFQAVKHIMADMFVRQEVARAAAYAAGATLDDPLVGDIGRAVSCAKITCGEAAMKNSRACIQLHGGMGFTWEVPAHYYLKRTWVFESLFGTIEEHAESVASHVAEQLAARE